MIRTEYQKGNWLFPFVLYTPNGYNGDKLPLIVQLHGAGERGSGGENLKLVETHGFACIIDEITDYPCLIAMPQCSIDSFWAAEIPYIKEFIEQLTARFNVSTISLTGISQGGYGTWFTAQAHSKMFHKIAPVCGGGMPGCDIKNLQMSVWAFHGAKDGVVMPYESERVIKAIQKAGGSAQFTLYKDVGHACWDMAYSLELLQWLIT